MKKILLNGIILIVFSLLGWEIGTGNFLSIPQKPSGTWEMVLVSKRPMFGDVAYNWPNKILFVEDDTFIYLVVGTDINIDDDSVWMCILKSNDCSKTNQETFPMNRNIIVWTHYVSETEIPPLPKETYIIEDILKIGEYNGPAGLTFVYYVLLTNGTIWRWYGGGIDGEYSSILFWIGGIGWVILLDIIAIIIIISLNQKPIEKVP